MKIPYGMSNFGDVRREGFFYVDKSPFIPLLESAESGYRYLVLLRPRRMGKSLLLSMLEHYYDILHTDAFDTLFGGLFIHKQPTEERNRYVVLSLDFSQVSTDGGQETLRRTFFESVKGPVLGLLLRARDRVPALSWLFDRIDNYHDAEALMGTLMNVTRSAGHKLYLLIDEYDAFANNLISAGHQSIYESLVEHTGFVRSFYRTLKSGTQSGAIGRLFVTGVSPIMLDDMASGFNIITHISNNARFNALAGFTRADVERAVDEFFGKHPDIAAEPKLSDRQELLAMLETYYNGYRFSTDAPARIFNSDMVLYFLRELENHGKYPARMLDRNVRTDYGRLQRLATVTGAAGGLHRTILETILTDGFIVSDLTEQFGVKSLSAREAFISLLYYLGMLTIAPQPSDSLRLRLEIPTRVIRTLQWEHMAALLDEQENLHLDTADLEAALETMAVQGEIHPFLDLFHARIVKAIGVKDLRQFSEKSLKLMLLTFISLSRVFHPLSEKEFAQGFCDLFLGVSPTVPAARVAWLIEIKYLAAANAKPDLLDKAFAQAEEQLGRYASDPHLVPLLTQGRNLKAGALVFIGADRYEWRPWTMPSRD